MRTEDASAAEALNRYLDDVAQDGGGDGPAPAPPLAKTVLRLHGLDDAFALESARKARMWAALRYAPRRDGARGRRLRERWWPAAELATAAGLIVLMLAMALNANRPEPERPARSLQATVTQTDAPVRPLDAPLYVTTNSGISFLNPIDPETLVDREDRQPVFLAPLTVDLLGWALSGDGSTLATIEESDPLAATIVIRDAVSGQERTRFPGPNTGITPRLSHDGTRLVVERSPRTGLATLATHWSIYDTRDGSETATVTPRDTVARALPGWIGSEFTAIDAAATRLYQLVPPTADPSASPPAAPDRPSRLLVYDLSTGAEIVQDVELPRVLDGLTSVPADDGILGGQYRYGMAVSPDGSRLAIPHLDGAAVTIVDTGTMTVEQEIPLLSAVGGIATPMAALPADDRLLRSAVFGPDGTRLYVFGFDGERTQGLQVIDGARGEVVGAPIPDQRLVQVVPGADGGSVYLVGWRPGGEAQAIVLTRLDALTLSVAAERTFGEVSAFPTILVQPAAADAACRPASEGDVGVVIREGSVDRPVTVVKRGGDEGGASRPRLVILDGTPGAAGSSGGEGRYVVLGTC